MEIAYSREAMHALLALGARDRARAIAAVESLTTADIDRSPDGGDGAAGGVLPISAGSEFKLVAFSPSKDLVVAIENDKTTVLALIDVIGALEGTNQR